MSDAFLAPAEIAANDQRRYSGKAVEKARIELRKLENRFVLNLGVTRVSFYALGVFGLLNALVTNAFLTTVFGSLPVITVISGLQAAAGFGFLVFGVLMKRIPGIAVLVAWLLTCITLLAGPLWNPILWFSIWTYILPLLQVLSLIFSTRFAWKYQRRKAYLMTVMRNGPMTGMAAAET